MSKLPPVVSVSRRSPLFSFSRILLSWYQSEAEQTAPSRKFVFAVLILSSYIYIRTHSVFQSKPHFLYFHYSAQTGLCIGTRLSESCSFCFWGRCTKAELFLLPAYRLWVTWRGWLRAAAAAVSFSSLPSTIPIPPLRPPRALASSSSLPS